MLGNCRVMCTPGVPSELRAMLDWIVTDLGKRLARPVERHILRLQTFGLGESTAQQMISDGLPDWPPEVELGFRAGAPQMEIKLSINQASAAPTQLACRQQLEALFGDHIIGEGDTQLAERVLQLLRERGETLATAESCTGGLIASMLTRIPGSSDGFHAGFVTYANDIKHSVLGVDEQTLASEGAVSEAAPMVPFPLALRLASFAYLVQPLSTGRVGQAVPYRFRRAARRLDTGLTGLSCLLKDSPPPFLPTRRHVLEPGSSHRHHLWNTRALLNPITSDAYPRCDFFFVYPGYQIWPVNTSTKGL